MKIKSIKNNGMKYVAYFGAGVIVLLYIFFFAAKFMFPQHILDADEVTPIGEKISYMSGRAYTLQSAVYSKEQRLMELIFRFENTSDGINDYYYTAVLSGKDEELNVSQIINEPLLTVIRIDGDKLKKYEEIELLFAPKLRPIDEISEDEIMHIYLNKHNVKDGHIDTKKTSTEYLIDRFRAEVKGLTRELGSKNEELKSHQKAITDLQKSNDKLTADMEFMTPDEQASAQAQIENNNRTAEEEAKSVARLMEEIETLSGKINTASAQLEKLEADNKGDPEK
jgi:hypothetical protein